MLVKKLAMPFLATGLLGLSALPTAAPQPAQAPGSTAEQDSTAQEVRQTILAAYKYSNQHKKAVADAYSKDGALEFWSSGGLLHEISPGGRLETYESISIHPKHIRVLTLVEGKAAVAHYYAEGSMKPTGSPAVAHYMTRATEVFVKEGGKWKTRSAHWSPVTGGAGTSQAASPDDK